MEWYEKFETIGEYKPIKEKIVLHENNQPERSKREDFPPCEPIVEGLLDASEYISPWKDAVL